VSASLTPMGATRPPLLQRVEVHHLGGGAVSEGQVVGTEGRMGETLMLAFTTGPLAGQSFLLRGLPRSNLLLAEPVTVPMVGELRCAPQAGE
jgi:hypothetical protein